MATLSCEMAILAFPRPPDSVGLCSFIRCSSCIFLLCGDYGTLPAKASPHSSLVLNLQALNPSSSGATTSVTDQTDMRPFYATKLPRRTSPLTRPLPIRHSESAMTRTRNAALTAALYLIVTAVLVVLVIIVINYFAPAHLQVDLNRPRFRLVRHRILLPDQEFSLEWKHINTWVFPPKDTSAVFGKTMLGGRYAWEIGGLAMRFEDIYGGEEFNYPSEEYLRTNLFSFDINTHDLDKADFPLRSAQDWARWR